MARCASTALCVLFVFFGLSAGASPLAAESVDASLFQVGITDRSVLARVAADGGRPIAVGPSYALILATAEEETLSSLRSLGPERLGRWDPDCLHYIVWFRGARGDVGSPEEVGEVLHRDPWTAVVRIPAEAEERLTSAFPSQRIWNRPLRDATERGGAGVELRDLRGVAPSGIDRSGTDRSVDRPRPRQAQPTHDPIIQAMVDAVDVERLRADCQWMQDIGSRVSTAAGGRIAQEGIEQAFRSMGYDVSTHFYRSGFCENVIALKRGWAVPEQLVVIGGHYDSISRGGNAPGADDNASGTSAVLEVARILADHAFAASILLIAWGGEEQGLIGSAAWCADAVDAGLDVRASINLDMLGYLAGPRDLDLIFDPVDQWLRDAVEGATDLYVPGLRVVDGRLQQGSSDHASFQNAGFPAVFFFEDSRNSSPYIHTDRDVIGLSLNDFDFFRDNVRAAVASVATLAVRMGATIDHEPLADTAASDGMVEVRARIRTARPAIPDSTRLLVRVLDGSFTPSPMWASGQPDSSGVEYVAELPLPRAGVKVEYYIRVVDEAGEAWTAPDSAPEVTWSFLTGMAEVFADDFETDRGWTVGAPDDDATSGVWVRAIPAGNSIQPDSDTTPDPGRFCFITGNSEEGESPGAADVDNGQTTLTSPPFSLARAQRAKLSYSRWYVDETREDDTLRVFASHDDGESWTLLEEVAGVRLPWRQVAFDHLGTMLPLTDRMRLRFVAEDRGLPSLVKAAVDDVEVTAWIPARVDSLPAPATAIALRVFPNPLRAETRIEFVLGSAAEVRLSVHDARGRLVRTLLRGWLPPGEQGRVWDGTNDGGRKVAGGVYYLRAEVGREVWESRAVLIP